MQSSLRAPRAAIAGAAAFMIAVAGAVAAPSASGQTPSPSPSGSGSGSPSPSPSGSPAPSAGELGVTLLNPSTGYDEQPKVSDRYDGLDSRYTIVAQTTGTAASPLLEASFAHENDDGTFQNEVLVGELAPIAAGSDVWQYDWDIPDSVPEGNGRITVRAYVDTPAGFVETGNDSVPVSVFHKDPSGPPLGAWETVDLLWPEQGGALGWYKPRVGAWRTTIDGRTSLGATHVQLFVSTNAPGEPPEFTGCGSARTVAGADFASFSGRCVLNALTLPSAVTSVAAVAEFREEVSGTRLLQAGDLRKVSSYDVSPSAMSVEITPVARRVRAPATTCQTFTVVVRDDHDRLVLGANVDVHAAGPSDQLILAGDFMFPPNTHTTEQTLPCPNPLPVPQTPRTQGDHNVPGGIDTKHMETGQGTGLDGPNQAAGEAAFAVASQDAGFTELTAWVDDEEVSSETQQRPSDDDRFDAGEPADRARVQWLTTSPTLSLDPVGGTAPAGACFPYVVKARSGTAVMPGLNVDVHAAGPDPELDFCDPPGASARRAPTRGAGAESHQDEEAAESHHSGSTGPATQHTEGETDAAGNFVVGLTSPVGGDTTVVAWADGEPGSDDDVQDGSESATSGSISWTTSTAEADLSFVNPSPYGGTTAGGGAGMQVSDAGGETDVVVRVDMAGSVPGVDVLLSTDQGAAFSLLGSAERVGDSDVFELKWPVHVPDGTYTLRARIEGTTVTEDATVTVGAGNLLPMVPNPSYETLEITRPQAASATAFSRRSAVVAGRASAGTEGVDVYYTKAPAKDTPRSEDWIFCGYAGLDGTGTGRQSFTTTCTLANADQPGQVTGIAAITYDCKVDGCGANPSPRPPAEGAPAPPREQGQKDTGDAVRVFAYEAQPLLSLEPAEAETLTGDCRRFEVVLRDQTGQGIGEENVDLHLTGPSGSAHFCRPAEGLSGLRAPDAGGHATTGLDPAAQIEAAHPADTGVPSLHAEADTLPDGTIVFGVTSEDEGDARIEAWLDRNDDDLHGDGEQIDTSLLHWVEPAGCSVLGSEGPDVLRGTPGADVFCGLEGNDTIKGRGGADTVFAGDGADRVFGGPGRDSLRGARGRDRLDGGRGTDVCRGGPGRDRIRRCEARTASPTVATRRSGV